MLLQPAQLRSAAKNSLAQADRPHKVILIHTGVILLLTLLLTVADHLLNQQISTTGGLRGMGMRSILTTVQSVLRLAQTVVIPFWQLGYTFYTLQVAHGQPSGISDLKEGFRRFAPILRLKMLMAVIAVLLAFICSYISSFLFVLSPWSLPLLQEVEVLYTGTTDEQALIDGMMALVETYQTPILIIFGICFAVCGFFLFFRFRLAELWLMDHPKGGAFAALISSHKLMRGNWKAMLRLDLSFWWFYLLELLISALYYGDVMLGSLGVVMTADAFGSYMVFFILYLCCQLALYWWKRNEVSVTYAHAYLALCPEEPEE